jgi:Anticodon binding domain
MSPGATSVLEAVRSHLLGLYREAGFEQVWSSDPNGGHLVELARRPLGRSELPVRWVDLGAEHERATTLCGLESARLEVEAWLARVRRVFQALGLELDRLEHVSPAADATHPGDEPLAGLTPWFTVDPAAPGPRMEAFGRDLLGRSLPMARLQVTVGRVGGRDLRVRCQRNELHPLVGLESQLVGALPALVERLLDAGLPDWLAPVQVHVLPVAARHAAAAAVAARALSRSPLRVRVGHTEGSLAARVRAARLEGAAWVGVVGDRELADGGLALRHPKTDTRLELSLGDPSTVRAWSRTVSRPAGSVPDSTWPADSPRITGSGALENQRYVGLLPGVP